jgi:hypothetical protein
MILAADGTARSSLRATTAQRLRRIRGGARLEFGGVRMRRRLADLLCGLVATWLAAYSALVGAMLHGWWSDPPGQLNRFFVLVFLLVYAALFLMVFSPLLLALGLGAGFAWPLVREAATPRARAARGAILGIVVAGARAGAHVAMSPQERGELAAEGPPAPVRTPGATRSSPSRPGPRDCLRSPRSVSPSVPGGPHRGCRGTGSPSSIRLGPIAELTAGAGPVSSP